MIEKKEHIPVMVQEVEGILHLDAGATVVDCTLGLGGHASVVAHKIGTSGRLIGIDQDVAALERAKEALKDFGGKLDIVKSNFRKLEEVLNSLGVQEVDAVFFDLGVSSLQLDDPERGFSFRYEGPLDMRMDQEAQVSAFELINSLSEEEISQLLGQYGEERFHRRVARAIVRARAVRPLATTIELADIIARSMPYRFQRDGLHPATRSFQGIRIAVNQELDAIHQALEVAFKKLKRGGRLCVISFHSLEDRIVKEQFRNWAGKGEAVLLTKKPLRPSEEEVQMNSRARSAKLRGLEKI